jgi:Domain of unknown function (DUF1330)
LAGIGIGAAAIHGLHAQTKLARLCGGRGARRADHVTPAGRGRRRRRAFDGPAPQRFVLLAFDNIDKALAWADLPATKEITAARINSTDSLSFIIEGVAP